MAENEQPNAPDNNGDYVYKHIHIPLSGQVAILKKWNESKTPPSIIELIKIVWPESTATARDFEGRAIRAFLASRNLRPRNAAEYVAKEAPELTDEQKKWISDNIHKFSSKNQAAEMAQIIFNNDKINNLNVEARVVDAYIATIPSIVKYKSEVPKEDYVPPNTPDRAIARVNKYIYNGIDRDKITPKIKKDMEALIGYLHTPSFIRQMNSYEDSPSRESLEEIFVRYTYDKCDLTEDEVDSFLSLANEKIISINIQKTIAGIQKEIDTVMQETARVPVSLVELVASVRKEFNDSAARQQKLLSVLTTKRSERIQAKESNEPKLTELFAIWQDEEQRKKFIAMNNRNREALKKDLQNLMDMDEVICRINGISVAEIIDG